MTTSKYRVAINGFWCHNETWDDVFNWDGKHDEVFLSVNTKGRAGDPAQPEGTFTNLTVQSEITRMSCQRAAVPSCDLQGLDDVDLRPYVTV